MRVAHPANLPFNVDRTQRAEAARAGVDAKVAGEVLTIRCRRRVEDGVRVEGVVHPEIEVGHPAVAGRRQHLGEHRHHAVFVLRQPHISATHPVVEVGRNQTHSLSRQLKTFCGGIFNRK